MNRFTFGIDGSALSVFPEITFAVLGHLLVLEEEEAFEEARKTPDTLMRTLSRAATDKTWVGLTSDERLFVAGNGH